MRRYPKIKDICACYFSFKITNIPAVVIIQESLEIRDGTNQLSILVPLCIVFNPAFSRPKKRGGGCCRILKHKQKSKKKMRERSNYERIQSMPKAADIWA